MTCPPSVTAELDAHVPLSACDASCGVASRATRSQTVFPVRRSMAYTTKRWGTLGWTPPLGACVAAQDAFDGIAVRRNSRSPQTTGEADPRPGISTFQR